MVQLSSIVYFAVAAFSSMALGDDLRDPRTTCATYTTTALDIETRYPKDVETSIFLYEYPVVTTTTVYSTSTSTLLYTTDRTRVRTRTQTQTVSACTVY
ncbi:uncharacterized protein PAC_15430 [Phialocephala subalpina]|uniref:Uncharacterized protein n=1 Tax=Phialocephala subalpina TaxID=576137 RepID=A0A1L7XKE9_9HELO|nr:uncharacterized protein PAC_15430 [Phialocephala subalpina]